jgi:hypothetical protein
MVARRAQTPVMIRSNRAAAKLAELTKVTGRSQADIIEDALERYPDPYSPESLTGEDAEQYARLKALIATIPPSSFLSMKEFDALEYDEFGDPR